MCSVAPQAEQPRVRRHEPARVEVEAPKVVIEVNVKPLTTGSHRLAGSRCDQSGADPTMSAAGGDQGVEDEGVGSAVPCDVGEADEFIVYTSTDPAKAVLLELADPVEFDRFVGEALGVQRLQLLATHQCPPLVDHSHAERVRPRHIAEPGAPSH